MRSEAILYEAARGVWTGTSRAVAHTLLAALISMTLVVADASITRSLIDEAERFQASGGSTLIVTAVDAIDGASCDALVGIEGITHAGALQESESPVIAAVLPGAPLKRYYATRGLVELLVDGPVKLDGLVISRELANALAASVGDVISTGDGPTLVSAIYDYPPDGRKTGLGWAVVEVGERAQYSECWAESWPMQPRLRSMLLTSLTTDGASNLSNPPILSQLNAAHGQDFDGATSWGTRLSMFGPFVTFALVAAFAAFFIWLRRLELASNLHAGVRLRGVIVIALLESSVWIGVAAAITTACGFVMSTGLSPDDRWAVAWIGLQHAASLLLGGVAGTVAGVVMIRERQLFRYFKNRA